MKSVYLLMFCICAALFQGCGGGQVSVKGTVTFPDGTPVPRGTVQFLTPTFVADGQIQPDGTYVIGSLKQDDGLPKGSYRVTVSAYEETSYAADMRMDEFVRPPGSLIDLRYGSPDTSGLTCDVQEATVFNIEVEPFRR